MQAERLQKNAALFSAEQRKALQDQCDADKHDEAARDVTSSSSCPCKYIVLTALMQAEAIQKNHALNRLNENHGSRSALITLGLDLYGPPVPRALLDVSYHIFVNKTE